ncbi:Molybdenum cofactor biosynthesis protein MoaD [hydrothermal vent metagenome]|uniref:Molybdenum cofactor biosynthesis protein MoaD n=1 Tax=hydrothermal vent metagenome TaxID=652676 RepID=A0A1W1C1F4_9ZZZZ
MQITIKYFASIRENIGFEEEVIYVKKSLNIIELKNKLNRKEILEKNVLTSVNHEIVNDDFLIIDECEVAFFPPVTGG